jgi:GNAT superfamily N-acetyltransferase
MSISIQRVTTRRGLADFLALPARLHAADPIYAPPLREDLARSLSDKNPLWRDGRGDRVLFVAYAGGQPVGRVLAHVHHASNRLHAERAGFFGHVEFGTDHRVAAALLQAAADHHRTAGLVELRGPYELTVTQCIGAVVSGFDEPASFSQSWNGPALPKVLEALGFEACLRMTTFRLDDVAAMDPEALITDKQRAWLDNPKVRLRTFDMNDFARDLDRAMALLNAAFAGNYGFVPLSPEELAFIAGPMKRVVRPELTTFIELDSRAVGVGMMMPDYNVAFRRMGGRLWPFGWAQFLLSARTIDNAVAQFIATDPALQNQGLLRIVVAEGLRQLKRAGFRSLDGTWISNGNAASRAQALAMGMREKHGLALYRRTL